MKKLKILSFAAVLFLVGCTTPKDSNNEISSDEISESFSVEDSSATSSASSSAQSSTPSSTPSSSKSSRSVEPYVPGTQELSQQSEKCKAYVDAMRTQQKQVEDDYKYDANSFINKTGSVDIANYYDTATYQQKELKSDHSYGVTVTFQNTGASSYTVEYGLKQDFSDALTVAGTPAGTKLVNLFSAKTYYWRVKNNSGQVVGQVNTFTTGDYPRWIDCGAMYNVRDMGGYMTSSGKRVKQGLIFRGGEITHKAWATDHTFTGDDAAKAVFRNTMKIGCELDLRRTADLGGGETYTSCMFAENNDIDYVNKQINSFANGVNNNASLIKDCFNLFANADQKPVYYHCHGGADRTGTLGFLLLGVLGVSYTDCVIDYELTSYSSIGGGDCKRSHLRSGQYNDFPGFMNALRTMKVNNQNIWDDSKSLKDNCEAYLTKKAGFTAANITKLRQIMLED